MIEIYWIEMLDGINLLLILTGVIILIVAAIMIAMSFGKKYEDDLSLKKSGIKLLFLSLVIFIICALVPNTNQAYKIYDASETMNYYYNGEAEQLPKLDKGNEVVNEWFDDCLEEDSVK